MKIVDSAIFSPVRFLESLTARAAAAFFSSFAAVLFSSFVCGFFSAVGFAVVCANENWARHIASKITGVEVLKRKITDQFSPMAACEGLRNTDCSTIVYVPPKSVLIDDMPQNKDARQVNIGRFGSQKYNCSHGIRHY